MKIAIFSDNFYPEISGISDSIISLAQELGRRGHTIAFFVPSYSKKNYLKVRAPLRELDLGSGIHIVRFASFPFRSGTGQGRLVIPTGLRAWGIKNFNPDIVHTQQFGGVGIEALIASRILKKPIVGTNHTAIRQFIRYSPIQAQWFANTIIGYVNWYYNHTDFVTAPSISLLEDMQRSGISRPTAVVSNPVDTETFSPNPSLKSALKKRFGLSNHTAVYAGRLSSEKGVDMVLRSFARVAKEMGDANLAIAGHGSEFLAYKRLAKDLGIADQVKFLGTLDKPALANLYRASEVFVIASPSETQSMAMLYAMASGLPVIGIDVPGLQEHIGLKNGILIEPKDEAMFANAMSSLFKNERVRQKLSSGAIQFAEQFRASHVADTWEKVYSEVITGYHSK